MTHADDEQVTFSYESSRNITFHKEGEELGLTWGEWRALSQKEKDAILDETLWEIVQISIDGDE